MINLQKTMENENDFRIRTYTKKELACLYCPNATARCAIRTLTRWIKRNRELYAELLLTGYNENRCLYSDLCGSVVSRFLYIPAKGWRRCAGIDAGQHRDFRSAAYAGFRYQSDHYL